MLIRILRGVLLVFGLLCLAKGSYIPAKAAVAQILMQHAWNKTQATRTPAIPWKGMDAYPAARLHLPPSAKSSGSSHIVLSQDSGQALAFGPAFIVGAAPSSSESMLAIAAHKNTQFKSLKGLKAGAFISLELPNKTRINYRVEDFEIIDTRVQGLPIRDQDTLALVTCYPFGAVSFNGPLRYVAYARKISPPNFL